MSYEIMKELRTEELSYMKDINIMTLIIWFNIFILMVAVLPPYGDKFILKYADNVLFIFMSGMMIHYDNVCLKQIRGQL